MRSIRRYLLVSLIIALATGSLIVTGITYVHASDEINELYDRNMMELAATLKSQLGALRLSDSRKGIIGPGLSMKLKQEQDYLVQIWDRKHRLAYISHSDMNFPYQSKSGLQVIEHEAKRWRTYGVHDDHFTVQISQPEHARDLFVREMALSLLYPLLGLIPIVGSLIWLAVGRSLRPLHIISQAITKRSATSLEPIGEQSIPLEIKPMVQELNKLLVRLDISLQAQRRFTADAAHELRTPLTALQLQLANLRRAKSESERATHADKLQEGMDRAANVVRQLLVMARVEPDAAEHSMTDVDLGEVICDATMRFAQEAVAKNIDLGIPRIEPVVLHGSIENLRVLIENLIGNAIRYTPAGGKVNVSLYQEEGVALLEVQDNGIGIPQEDRLRIFERFYRVQGNDTEGAGLGLSIAKDVVEQHRGTIEVGDGLNGKGTTFRLRLPVS